MSNPLFDILNSNMAPNNLGNIGNMLSAFYQFKNSFKGNPKQQVEELLKSGKMSQEQFNQLSHLANEFQRYLK